MNKRVMFIVNRNGSSRTYDDTDGHSDRADRMSSIARTQDWRRQPMVYVGHLQQAGYRWSSGEVRRVYGEPMIQF